MKITNIVKFFPKIEVGSEVTFTTRTGQKIVGDVIARWYPKKGDLWTEEEELERMGHLGSLNREAFPQIRLFIHHVDGVAWEDCTSRPQERTLTVVGSDYKQIVSSRTK